MKTIERDELWSLLKRRSDFTLISVLPEDRYEKEHIPGSYSIPMRPEDFRVRARNVAPSKRHFIVVYGEDEGGVSSLAARALEEEGYTDVAELSGGLSAWKSAELPVIQGRGRLDEGVDLAKEARQRLKKE